MNSGLKKSILGDTSFVYRKHIKKKGVAIIVDNHIFKIDLVLKKKHYKMSHLIFVR